MRPTSRPHQDQNRSGRHGHASATRRLHAAVPEQFLFSSVGCQSAAEGVQRCHLNTLDQASRQRESAVGRDVDFDVNSGQCGSTSIATAVPIGVASTIQIGDLGTHWGATLIVQNTCVERTRASSNSSQQVSISSTRSHGNSQRLLRNNRSHSLGARTSSSTAGRQTHEHLRHINTFRHG